MEVSFFESSSELRRWLAEHHDKAKELWVGFYKKSSGRPSITYAEALDEALCFGWIAGVRKSIDADSYTNRFSPRQRRSIWSEVNIERAGELLQMGRMHPSGFEAYRRRDEERSKQYSYEARSRPLEHEYEASFERTGRRGNSSRSSRHRTGEPPPGG